MKYVTYSGCIVTFILFQIHNGPLFVIGNVFFFFICAMYIMKVKKSKGFASKKGGITDVTHPMMVIVGMMGLGFIHALYLMYRFYKYPITTEYSSKEEFDDKIRTNKLVKEREKRLKEILK